MNRERIINLFVKVYYKYFDAALKMEGIPFFLILIIPKDWRPAFVLFYF